MTIPLNVGRRRIALGALPSRSLESRFRLGALLSLTDLSALLLAMFIAVSLREAVPLPWPAGGTVLILPYAIAITCSRVTAINGRARA